MIRSGVALLLICAAPVQAQAVGELIDRLADEKTRARATIALRSIGEPAAKALVDAMLRGDVRTPLYAEVSSELGAATAPEVSRLVGLVETHGEPVRSSLLRALANGLLAAHADDCDTLRAALPAWEKALYFYSADPDEPTFAWYEYVRIKRRLKVRPMSSTPGLLATMLAIHAERAGFAGGLGGDKLFDLGSVGRHATREEIEAVAEFALTHGADAVRVVAELAKYLACEEPRPGIILTEHCAGIGEYAPMKAPEVDHPTLWRRDDWRFAIARAVVAIGDDGNSKVHALRHLLHAPLVADRMAALEAVRAWPQPWNEFAPDLEACLTADDRIVVRSALVILGLAEGLPMPTAALRTLAEGKDRELALLAKRLLQ